MKKYLIKARKLKDKAKLILDELDIIRILKKVGRVEIVGSYALDLMSWEDIDITVTGELDYKKYLEVANYMFQKEKVYSLNLQDFRKSIYPNRPQGIYLGVKYLEDPDIFWKIDIWFFNKGERSAKDIVEFVKENITKEKREIILNIKNKIREKTESGKEISGKEVYEAVLREGIEDLRGFKRYMTSKGFKW